jgi:hypothetical protein
MALLQFMTTQIPRVRVPTSVHTDHLITARDGAKADLDRAVDVNKEVYDFLETSCAKVSISSLNADSLSTGSNFGNLALGSCIKLYSSSMRIQAG